MSADRSLAIAATERAPEAVALAQQLWSWAEVGYQETRSSAALVRYLEAGGFDVEVGVGGMPTAFVATYGSGKPVIGILAEYDALPGLSQTATPIRKVLEPGAAGHACGHHLFGAASALAGRTLAQWLAQRPPRSGTVKVFGTPAEEGGSGKVYLVRAGVFSPVDIMLHWHPGDANDASAFSTTANKSGRLPLLVLRRTRRRHPSADGRLWMGWKP